MSTFIKSLAPAVVLAAVAAAGNVRAQYSATGADGIAASPKLRVALSERAANSRPAEAVAAARGAGPQDGIAASPKLRQQMEKNRIEPGATSAAPRNFRQGDGRALSPKLRSQMGGENSQ